jgi:DNA-binding TFAR19-related protein (PDSD5 family)
VLLQARAGTLREKVTEAKLCELLEEEGKSKQTKVSIQRRVVKGFDDDDDDDDSDMM